MDVNLRLLGEVNRDTRPDGTVRPRYIAVINAETLAGFMHFDRTGGKKSDRFRLASSSFLQIDPEIQRGRDSNDALLQTPAKVESIATTLLGKDRGAAPIAFLGTLIWNVRPGNGVSVRTLKISSEDGDARPTYELRISAPHAWLTDSAHRHLGIALAMKRYKEKTDQYPRFDPRMEFVVEIYQLDKATEKSLFYELNALQKRITAAKRKEMDSVTSAGFVKDAIREYDMAGKRLFQDNIEVTANTNVNHTLMTMSLFVNTIHDMFAKSDLDEAKTSDVKRQELAEYYCNFFYKLNQSVVVNIKDADGASMSVKPFSNLYTEFIQPVINDGENSNGEEGANSLDAKMDEAHVKAKRQNERIRSQDVSLHNTVVRALCRIARLVRPMPHWDSVIDYLQTKLNSPHGTFFQASNPELTAQPGPDSAEVQLARTTETGINVQVQSQTLASWTRYLRKKLRIDLPPSLSHVPADDEEDAVELPLYGNSSGESRPILVGRQGQTHITLESVLYLAGDSEPEEPVRLALKPEDGIDWRDMTLTGNKRLSSDGPPELDESYQHPIYGNEVRRYVARFTVPIPKAPSSRLVEAMLVATLGATDLDGTTALDTKFALRLVLQ